MSRGARAPKLADAGEMLDAVVVRERTLQRLLSFKGRTRVGMGLDSASTNTPILTFPRQVEGTVSHYDS